MLPDSYFDRFETKKYRTQNPVQRLLIRRFVTALHSVFVGAGPAERVLEIGVGEGFVSGYLSEAFPEKKFEGIDSNAGDIERLRAKFPRIEAHVAQAEDLSCLTPPYDLVLMCEVLEHVDDPEKVLASIRSLGNRRFIFTVPNEPYFMLSNLARLKNVSRFGNDPEHLHHWGTKSFARLLSRHFEVLHLETSYPWIIALCAP